MSSCAVCGAFKLSTGMPDACAHRSCALSLTVFHPLLTLPEACAYLSSANPSQLLLLPSKFWSTTPNSCNNNWESKNSPDSGACKSQVIAGQHSVRRLERTGLTCRPTRMQRMPQRMKKATVPIKPAIRKPNGSCCGNDSWRLWPTRKAVIIVARVSRYFWLITSFASRKPRRSMITGKYCPKLL